MVCAAEMALGTRPDSRKGVRFHDSIEGAVQLYSETPGYLVEISPEDWEGLADIPSFASVAGRVTDTFSLAGRGWEYPMEDLLTAGGELLERIIWREEVPE